MTTPGRPDRVFAAMADAGIDALVLGRQDNATWATGMHRLWTAGTRPFGAGCVLVGETRGVHILSSWDDGVPGSVPFDHLYGITWNPAIMAESMAAIPGLADASVLGVDAMSPGFRRAAAGFAPGAELFAADRLLADLRRSKTDEDIEAIRQACVVAAVGLDALREALVEPIGITTLVVDEHNPENQTVLEAVCRAGGTVPSSGVAINSWPSGVRTIDIGLLVGDWEGGLGRTVSAEGQVRGGRTEERVRALMAGCKAGATGRSIAASGGTERWLVRGVGMGFEHPVIGPSLGEDVELVPGDVLSIEVSGEERHHREIVHVGDGTSELLSRPGRKNSSTTRGT